MRSVEGTSDADLLSAAAADVAAWVPSRDRTAAWQAVLPALADPFPNSSTVV
jgi:hypothetical protein